MHIGHLLLAEAALVQVGLSRVLFMPTHIQPFKQGAEVPDDDDRVRMLRLAMRGNPCFDVTTVETDKGGVSYTIDSLRELRSCFPDARLCFIIGADMFLNVEKWKGADTLLREFDFAVGVRPGTMYEDLALMAEKLRRSYGTRVDFVDNPPIELSSTEIRARVRDGDTIRYLTPESVRRYLLVRKREGNIRFAHTKRVMDLAAELAAKFGEDLVKTETAALFHDYCKESEGGIANDLMHGAMAADAAQGEFGVTDADVLNAIRYHTTGRAGMSRLEKIVFLADTVEPGRKYESIEALRTECLGDLDAGTLKVLTELKKYLIKKGLSASRDTEEAISSLCGIVA